MHNPFIRKKGTPEGVTSIPIKEVQTHRDFESLFPINKKVRDSIAQSIRKEGFNEDFPLIIWAEENILIDGHTRLSAAKRAILKKVPVTYKSFPSKQDAINFAVSLQMNRRNLTDADLFSFILTLDTEDLPGSGRKQDKLARVANISVTKAMRILKVKKDAPNHLKAQILEGSSSINSIYNKINNNKAQMNSRKKKSPKKPSQSLTIDPGFLEDKVDEWLSVFKDSDGTDISSIQKVEAVLEILPAGKFKSSLTMKLPEDYRSP
jgi:ParB family chromosome partitioning protein